MENFNIYDMWKPPTLECSINSIGHRRRRNGWEEEDNDYPSSQTSSLIPPLLTGDHYNSTLQHRSTAMDDYHGQRRSDTIGRLEEGGRFSLDRHRLDQSQRAAAGSSLHNFGLLTSSPSDAWKHRFFDAAEHPHTTDAQEENTLSARTKRPLDFFTGPKEAKKAKATSTSPQETWTNSTHQVFEGLMGSGEKHQYEATDMRKKANHFFSSTSMPDTWSQSMHRKLVESIYDSGVKHASPSIVMGCMTETKAHVNLTNERVKSHLQKYRTNKDKSKEEFFLEYDRWIQKALMVGTTGESDSALVSPASLVEIMGVDSLLGGDVAALLSYAAMAETAAMSDGSSSKGAQDLVDKLLRGTRIPFPVLSEEERKSPIGLSIKQALRLFQSLTQYVTTEREAKLVGEPKRAGGPKSAGDPRSAGDPKIASQTCGQTSDNKTELTDRLVYDQSSPASRTSGA
jgi:SHAQKYF class myb-like DNA-binding protein